jgi:hypothetical protein
LKTFIVETHGDGRSAYFSHYAGGAASCPLGVEGRSPALVNAEKFDGALESEEHIALKAMVAQMLAADAQFTGIGVEAIVHGRYGWRKPDLSAQLHNRLVAFEVQLSTISLVDIVARERFYEDRLGHLIWLTTPAGLARMESQAVKRHHSLTPPAIGISTGYRADRRGGPAPINTRGVALQDLADYLDERRTAALKELAQLHR